MSTQLTAKKTQLTAPQMQPTEIKANAQIRQAMYHSHKALEEFLSDAGL